MNPSNFFVPIPMAQIGPSSNDASELSFSQELLFWSSDGAHAGPIDTKWLRPHAPLFPPEVFSPPSAPETLDSSSSANFGFAQHLSEPKLATRSASKSLVHQRTLTRATMNLSEVVAATESRETLRAVRPPPVLRHSRSYEVILTPVSRPRANTTSDLVSSITTTLSTFSDSLSYSNASATNHDNDTQTATTRVPKPKKLRSRGLKPKPFSLLPKRVPIPPLQSLAEEAWGMLNPFGPQTSRPTPQLSTPVPIERSCSGPSVSDSALNLSAHLKRQTTIRFQKTSAFVKTVEDDAATRIQRAWRQHQMRMRWQKFPQMVKAVAFFVDGERKFVRELNELLGLAKPLQSVDPKAAGRGFDKLFGVLPTLVKLFTRFEEILCSGEYSLHSFHLSARFLKEEILPLLFVYSRMIPEVLIAYSQLKAKKKSKSKELERARLSYLLLCPVNHLERYQQIFLSLSLFEQTRSFAACHRALNNLSSSI